MNVTFFKSENILAIWSRAARYNIRIPLNEEIKRIFLVFLSIFFINSWANIPICNIKSTVWEWTFDREFAYLDFIFEIRAYALSVEKMPTILEWIVLSKLDLHEAYFAHDILLDFLLLLLSLLELFKLEKFCQFYTFFLLCYLPFHLLDFSTLLLLLELFDKNQWCL